MNTVLTPNRPAYLLPVIVLAQFAGTSLWFAGNAVLPDLQRVYELPAGALGNLTSAVQFGFISGTLVFAILAIADRFSPSRVFFLSALLGALFNLGVYFFASGFFSLLVLRFLTGFFLAGIYPVGMKISADWYSRDLGKALGYLVGALVLGKAFPFFLKFSAGALPWYSVMLATSGFAVLGGALIFFLVPDGPFRTKGKGFQFGAIFSAFRIPAFKGAAFGYFGHMWELYAFWAFIPVLLSTYQEKGGAMPISASLGTFLIIAAGFLGCVIGGYWSMRIGSARVAWIFLLISGLCCLFSPLLFWMPFMLLLPFLLVWGLSVVGDSPQYSTLVAQAAPKELVGSALTIVNCIGFAITIFSIELLNLLAHFWQREWMFLFLALGPAFGLWALSQLSGKRLPIS